MRTFIKKVIRYALSPLILLDYFKFKRQSDGRFSLSFSDFYPCVKDKTVTTRFDRHYIYHTSWAARIVKQINPAFHIDISSSLYFSGIVSAFIPIKFYDYRPANLILSDLESKKGDLHNLPFENNSVKSISCMHTIEHVGLGRYGDPIDSEGDIKAIKELKRVVANGGSLLFVTPVGKQKIEFNAHRIYSYDHIIELFTQGPDALKLREFSLIPEFEENGGIIKNATKEMADKEHYGCGCFWFVK